MYSHLDIDSLRVEIKKSLAISYASFKLSNRLKEELEKRIESREEDFYKGDRVIYKPKREEKGMKGTVVDHDQANSSTVVDFERKGLDSLRVMSMYLTIKV